MPAKDVTVPSTLKGEARKTWLKIYQSAWDSWSKEKTDKSRESYSAAVAWAGLKKAGFHKGKDGKWVKKAHALRSMAFNLRITKARTDEDGTVRWHANAANDEVDEDESEVLDPSLFDDLAYNFDMVMKAYSEGTDVPDFGQGPALLPILDLAHYSCIIPADERDSARVGAINKLYRDGRYLHATGVFDNTPQGKLASKAVLEDEGGVIRTSVGFYPDWGNIRIENDILYWMGGREPPKAYLDHIAVTTVPRIESTTIEAGGAEVTMSDDEVLTMADDAKQILGDEGEAIIEELEGLVEGMKSKSMVLKAEAKAEDEVKAKAKAKDEVKVEDEIKVKADVGGPDKCVCPDCEYEAEKKRGTPCRDMECPKCGAKLVAGSASKEKVKAKVKAKVKTEAKVKVKAEGEIETTVEKTPVVEEVVSIVDGGHVLLEVAEADKPVAVGEIKKESETSADAGIAVIEAVEEMLVQKPPYGGATSFEEAIEWNEATTEKWRIVDGWSIFQLVMDNILGDDEIEDRPLAISRALAEFQAFLTSGKKVWSRVVEDDMETIVDEQLLPVEPTEATPVEEPEVVVEPVEIKPEGEVLCGVENLASEVTGLALPQQGVEPPEAAPMSMVEGPGSQPVQGVAKSFAEAVDRLARISAPRGQKRQAVKEIVDLAETQLNEALDTTSDVDVEALVNDVVGAAIAPVQAELAEINTLLRQVVSQSDVSEPVAPRRPQRKSHVPKPNIKPARVTTMAKTFSEVVDRLLQQRYG